MELLAPAGDRESLKAAVSNGADAVYFGGGSFNARRYAANFDGDAMREAVDYCHIRNVKAYITLNTLILDKEMPQALDYAYHLCLLGVDAVLVQDMGLYSLLRAQLPTLPLHASTQMAVHDLEGVKQAAALGFQRTVLARETPLDAIAYIHAHSDMELEAFVHGALCMSFSGLCLFSSMVGERSGNRGTCAQPCRKRISVNGAPGETDYHLSLSDLCMVEHLHALEQAGVCSLKIEGRMKRPAYVAAVTRAYRAALDGADAKTVQRYMEEAFAVFNRGGKRTGYFFGDGAVTNCMARSEPSQTLVRALTETCALDRRRPVSLTLTLNENRPALLELSTDGAQVQAEGETVQTAQKAPDIERYKEQLAKLGDTPFCAAACSVCAQGAPYLPVRAVNALRREACARLEDALCPRRSCAAPHIPESRPAQRAEPPLISAKVRTLSQLAAADAAGAQTLLLEPWDYARVDCAALYPYRDKLLLALPPVICSKEEHAIIEKLLSEDCFCGAEANNIGQLSLISHRKTRRAGLHMNAVNRYTVDALKALGCTDVTLSPELAKPQLRDVLRYAGGIVSVYGRTPLMQLKHCPVKEHRGCLLCAGDAGAMRDEAGRIFPLFNIKQTDGCLVRLFNCEVTDILDVAGELPAANGWLLTFYDEDGETVGERVRAALCAARGEPVKRRGTTRGHWNRPLE